MLGILTQNLHDQILIDNLNVASKHTNAVVFCDKIMERSTPLNFSVLQLIEAFHFSGNAITNNLGNLQQAINLGYAKTIYYYVQNYDWASQERIAFKQIQSLIMPDYVHLIAKDDHDYELLSSLFNKKPKYVMQNWDHNVLVEIGNG